MAQVLARLAVRPIELILAQPELIQDIGEEELNWLYESTASWIES